MIIGWVGCVLLKALKLLRKIIAKIVFGFVKWLESFENVQLYETNRVEDYWNTTMNYYVNINDILDQYLGKNKSIFMGPNAR
jgi:hypothetical protein